MFDSEAKRVESVWRALPIRDAGLLLCRFVHIAQEVTRTQPGLRSHLEMRR